MDKTASRIIMAKEIRIFSPERYFEIIFPISKWGCDGSNGHSELMQRSLHDAGISDFFLSSVVPRQFIQQTTWR